MQSCVDLESEIMIRRKKQYLHVGVGSCWRYSKGESGESGASATRDTIMSFDHNNYVGIH